MPSSDDSLQASSGQGAPPPNSSCPPESDVAAQSHVSEILPLTIDNDTAMSPAAAPGSPSEPKDGVQEVEGVEVMAVECCAVASEGAGTALTYPYFSRGDPLDSDTVLPPSLDRSAVSSSSDNLEFSSLRVLPHAPSSFLRYGSRFVGQQQSDKQVYSVEVEIKHVDLLESSICGYLRIDGLTPEHPTLTTYFDGEIIGAEHGFVTRHASWGATEKSDMQHWERFPAFRPFAKSARKADFRYANVAQRENVFMRWKEKFLVPDYRVREISGASFEGFYYICFNQVTGTITGIYFHAKSEKYQHLELRPVQDRFCFGSVEYR